MVKEWKEAMVGEGSFAMTEAIQAGEIGRERTSNNMRLSNYDSKTGLWEGEDGKKYNAIWNAGTKRFDVTEFNAGPKIGTDGIEGSSKDIGNGKDYTEKKEEPLLKGYAYFDAATKTYTGQYISQSDALKASQDSIDLLRAQLASKSGKAQRDLKNATEIAQQEYVEQRGGKGSKAGQDAYVQSVVSELKVAAAQALKLYNNSLALKASTKAIYATGGLNTSTGPAWLDGTPSKPEYVLNARDTQVYLTLTNLLNKLLSNSSSVSDSTSSGGDNYFNIDINVDELGSDYDVDQLMERIRSQIVDDAMYRNVNVINLHR